MLSIYGVKQGFNYLPLLPLTNCIGIGVEPDTHECPGEHTTSLSQFWWLEATQSFSVTDSGTSILCGSLSSPYTTTGCDLVLKQMEFWDFTYREFSLPSIHNVLMPESMKRSIWINGGICPDSDGHDWFLECFSCLSLDRCLLSLWPCFSIRPRVVTMGPAHRHIAISRFTISRGASCSNL
jgi:hypothetical protein